MCEVLGDAITCDACGDIVTPCGNDYYCEVCQEAICCWCKEREEEACSHSPL